MWDESYKDLISSEEYAQVRTDLFQAMVLAAQNKQFVHDFVIGRVKVGDKKLYWHALVSKKIGEGSDSGRVRDQSIPALLNETEFMIEQGLRTWRQDRSYDQGKGPVDVKKESG